MGSMVALKLPLAYQGIRDHVLKMFKYASFYIRKNDIIKKRTCIWPPNVCFKTSNFYLILKFTAKTKKT